MEDTSIQNIELLETVLNNTTSCMMLLKPVKNKEQVITDFEYLFANAQALRSVDRKLLIGKYLTEEFPKLKNSKLLQVVIQVMETGMSYQSEIDFRSYGAPMWIQLYAKRTGDSILITYFDITARKQAEQETKQQSHIAPSKELLQSIIDAPALGLAVYKAVRNEDHEIIDFIHEFVNRTTCETLGQDFTGKLLTDHGPDGIKQLKHFVSVIETGNPVSYIEHVELNGSVHWISFTNSSLGDDRLVHMWEDITHQKKADAELVKLKEEVAQKATDRYYSIFNTIDEGFCIYELVYQNGKAIDLRWMEVNPAYEKQTGLKNAAGKLVSELLPGTENNLIAIYEKVIKTGEAVHFESWHEPMEKWYSTFSSRIGGTGSKQIAVLYADITERKNTEERQAFLLKLSDRLRPLRDAFEIQREASKVVCEHFHLNRVSYIEIDADGDTISSMQGYSTDNPLKLAPGTKISGFGKLFLPAYAEGRTLSYTDVENTRDFIETDRLLFQLTNTRAFVAVPLIKEGHLLALLGTSSSVPRKWKSEEIALIEEVAQRTWATVEKARAEEALQKSEKKYRLLTSATSETIYEMSADWNEMHYLYGKEFILSTKEPYTDWMQMYIPPDEQVRVRAAITDAIKNKSNFELEHRVIQRDGTVGWIFSRAIPVLNAQDEILEWFGAASDITSRKKAEEALQNLNDNLEQLVQKRTQQLTNLKINQEKEKLNAIIFAEEQERARISEALHNGIAQLLYAVQSRLQLVRSVEPGSIELKASTDILTEAIKDTRKVSFELMPPMLRNYGLEVCLETLINRIVDGRLNLILNAQIEERLPEKLEITIYRIIQEILNNILKHAKATEASINIKTSTRYVYLKATDNGVGFIVKQPKKVYRGIGLQSIRNRVKLLNGKININSVPGQGCSMELQLPLKEKR